MLEYCQLANERRCSNMSIAERQAILNMECVDCMSQQEESDYVRELEAIEGIIKSVDADKMNPQNNYKLIYR